MILGEMVVDRELLDREGHRAGKVDDLVLELEEGARPRVAALVTGPMALGERLPGPLSWLARRLHGLLGVAGEPVEIPWERVATIHSVVQVDVDREEAGLTALARAIDARILGRIPGARARP